MSGLDISIYLRPLVLKEHRQSDANKNGDRVTDLVLVGDALQVWVVHLMTIMIINNAK